MRADDAADAELRKAMHDIAQERPELGAEQGILPLKTLKDWRTGKSEAYHYPLAIGLFDNALYVVADKGSWAGFSIPRADMRTIDHARPVGQVPQVKVMLRNIGVLELGLWNGQDADTLWRWLQAGA